MPSYASLYLDGTQSRRAFDVNAGATRWVTTWCTSGVDASTGWTVQDTYVSTCGWHGYAWVIARPATAGMNQTISAIAMGPMTGSAICCTGTVAAQTDYSGYGAFAVNVAQEPGESTPAVAPSPSGHGVQILASNPGGTELRAQIQAAQGSWWCASWSGSGGIIPWPSFNTECWSTSPGTAYAEPPINPMLATVPGDDAQDAPFDFSIESTTRASRECGAGSTGAGGTSGRGWRSGRPLEKDGAGAGGEALHVDPRPTQPLARIGEFAWPFASHETSAAHLR